MRLFETRAAVRLTRHCLIRVGLSFSLETLSLAIYAATTRCLLIKRVRIGSLVAARRKDSRATDSVTPSSSKRMFPGRTVATQCSGLPLPFPIRVSGGLWVIDLSGKILIQSLPLRFMLRVKATRAASTCVLVIQARSSVCKAYSPKAMETFRVALPARLPRCVLRYFTLFGINGINQLLVGRYLTILKRGRALDWPLSLAAVAVQQPAQVCRSSILPRFFHKRYLLRQIHNQWVFEACAAESFLPCTIRRAKSPPRRDGPSSESLFRARQHPWWSGPLSSWPDGTRYGARSATRRFPQPVAHQARAF